MRAKKLKLNNATDGEKDILAIRKSFSEMPGVKAVRVDTVANTVTVDYDDAILSPNALKSKMDELNNSLR